MFIIWDDVLDAPVFQNLFYTKIRMLKHLKKKYVYISEFYVLIKSFHEKIIFFVLCVKKAKFGAKKRCMRHFF
jgi:hypothetical protein